METPDWMVEALCKGMDPELFFPGVGISIGTLPCKDCPVKSECLEFGLKTSKGHGIYGGKSERQRRRIKRARKAGAISVRS